MKVINTLFLIIVVTVFSCDDDVSTHDVIEIKSNTTEINADGASVAKITASIPEAAMSDKRTIAFKTLTGVLEDSVADTQSKKVSLKADQHIGNHWAATTRFTAGLDPGDIYIYASIEGIVDSVKITLKSVAATKIQLAADSFAVPVGYAGEINLVASLSSDTGKASKGQKVKFTDTYENGTAVGGAFRNLQLSSDGNSQAKVTYSPGPVSSGVYVILKAILLDANGGETGIQSSVKIYLKPE